MTANRHGLAGFRALETHHCVSGSMRNVYVYHEHDISEEMLLGIGAGVSYSYWHFQGQPPFIGGRGMPKPSMEELAGQRTGVEIQPRTSTSSQRARRTMLEMLEAGQPVMIQCDMGFLPYFDFDGSEYHFGGHVIVVCGYDPEADVALVADRDGKQHRVPMTDLAQARGSTFKPFPPKNRWYTFDFGQKRQPTSDEVRLAIRQQAQPMLEPPIRNIGVKGILKTADLVPAWPESMTKEQVRSALFNCYIFVSPAGGTGGGAFRYMFSRFLTEAAEITGDSRFQDCAGEFERIGDKWAALGDWFLAASEDAKGADRLGECVAPLEMLAGLEQGAWRRLQEISE